MTKSELEELQLHISIPELTVDLWEDKYCHISAKQMDNARHILVTVTEHGIPKTFTDETTVNVRVRKPDGSEVYNPCELIEDGRILIHLTEQILAVSGCAEMDLQFIKGSKIYSTKNMHIDIVSTPYPNSAISSSYEFDALNRQIEHLESVESDIKSSEKKRETQENARTENESIRQENENTRIDSEENRVSAERTRIDNEAARNEKENTRISNEESRKNNENDREEAESARVDNENNRIENEQARNFSENERSFAENQRHAAENERQQYENTRQNDESTRQTQESLRQRDTAIAITNAQAAADNANDAAQELQDKLDSHHFVLTEDKDMQNGVAGLDENTKVPISELYEATASSKGIVQLNNIPDNSTFTAATPKLVQDAVSSHDTSSIAHDDIRNLISELSNRLNSLADSDDTTLDQLSEIVAYIKSNRGLIENVTTNKINVSDIIDNLTSTSNNKPLSANQGKILNDLITALDTTVTDKVDKVSGKGLSTNDYTTAEKNKLSGIASGAEVNVQSDWNVTDTGSDSFIKNKPTSMPASDVHAWAKTPTKPTYTKSEVGLSDVPNVATNDQTPTFTQATARENITSGEKISVILGKIKKWFTDLKAVAFSGSYNDLSNKPTIPAPVRVKGDAESSYRTGDVNITAANVGALSREFADEFFVLNQTKVRYAHFSTNTRGWHKVAYCVGDTLYSVFDISICRICGVSTEEFYLARVSLKKIDILFSEATEQCISQMRVTKDNEGKIYFEVFIGGADYSSYIVNIYNRTHFTANPWEFENFQSSDISSAIISTYLPQYCLEVTTDIQQELDEFQKATVREKIGLGSVDNTADADKAVFLADMATQDGNGNVITDTYVKFGSTFIKSGADAKEGLVPQPSTTAGSTKYLCENGTWKTPPNTNTWQINTNSQAGYVPAPNSLYNHVYHTDRTNGPAWRESADFTHSCQKDSISFGTVHHIYTSASYSVAIGVGTTHEISKKGGCAIGGYQNKVWGEYGTVLGYRCSVDDFAGLTCGKYPGGSVGESGEKLQTGTVFKIGNGYTQSVSPTLYRSNAFRVQYDGTTYAKSFLTTGADYAEFIYEWYDNNENEEDRVGYFVTIKDQKLYKSSSNDYIAGIVSGNPSVIGNSDEDYFWKYERDEFNRVVFEDVTEEIPIYDEETKQPLKDENGNQLFKTETFPKGRMKLSETYDSNLPYVERKDRKEWDYVGMLGVLPVRDDGTCIVGQYCKCNNNGVATLASIEETTTNRFTYMVIERITPNIVKVILK